MTIPPSWLAAADGLFTIALALLAYRLWPRLRREPGPAMKLAAGGLAMTLAYILLAGLSGGAAQVGLIGPSARSHCCRSGSSCPGPRRWPSSRPPRRRHDAG